MHWIDRPIIPNHLAVRWILQIVLDFIPYSGEKYRSRERGAGSMTIKEVEKCTGLSRSNVRFYEKEKLIEPLRNEHNGYRDYSESDIEDNRSVLKLDSVSFLYIWGSFVVWAVITALCLVIGILSYAKLPAEIPVQWSDGEVTSLVDKMFIFAYPAVCIAIRCLLRPVIRVKLQMHYAYGEIVTEYLTNYLCFIALSAEVFSILFTCGLVENVVTVLFIDTVVLIGILVVGVGRIVYKRDAA